MPFSDQPLGVITPKEKTPWYVWFIIIALILTFIGQYVNFTQNQRIDNKSKEIKDTQADGIVRGYILRAVICDMSKGIGATEPKFCADTVIKPYRDPTIVEGSTAGARASNHTLQVVCAIIKDAKVSEAAKTLCKMP